MAEKGEGGDGREGEGEFDGYLKRWVEEMFGEGVEGDGDEDGEGAGQAGGRGRAGKRPVAVRDCGGGGDAGGDDDEEKENEEVDCTPTSSDGEWHQAQHTTKNTTRRN